MDVNVKVFLIGVCLMVLGSVALIVGVIGGETRGDLAIGLTGAALVSTGLLLTVLGILL